MKITLRAFGLTLLLVLVSSLVSTLPAAALDGCPGGFTLEGGCVLCLPGYSPQKTGTQNPQGHDCYACLPNRSAADFQAQPICRQPGPVQPVEHATPTFQP